MTNSTPLAAEAGPPRTRLRWSFVKPSVIPGFGLTLGYTLVYLSLIVLIPIAALFIKALSLSPERIWSIATDARTIAALRTSFGTALVAAMVNVVFGVIVAWVLVRYRFWGRRLLDAIVDLPFALPTAVAGIALSALYAPKGWVGRLFDDAGPINTWLQSWLPSLTFLPDAIRTFEVDWKIAYTPAGITLALIFIGLPFVVRTVQPILEEFEQELEEAAATLGANRFQIITMVILPRLTPAILTGFALAFARAVGEYGSVIFIAGNIPYVSEIAPLLIIIRLEEFDQGAAAVVASIMLILAFALLLAINLIQSWSRRRFGDGL